MGDKKIFDVYPLVLEFKRKYPLTVAWRLKSHCNLINLHLNRNEGEYLKYAFTAQRNDNPLDVITTCVVALTNKRILVAQKRLFFGYFFFSITPDLFNDLHIYKGLIWGRVYIDTIKEVIKLSNIDPNALPEIETSLSEYMIEEKRKYLKDFHHTISK